jgi:hypothetical protein
MPDSMANIRKYQWHVNILMGNGDGSITSADVDVISN